MACPDWAKREYCHANPPPCSYSYWQAEVNGSTEFTNSLICNMPNTPGCPDGQPKMWVDESRDARNYLKDNFVIIECMNEIPEESWWDIVGNNSTFLTATSTTFGVLLMMY